jgi:transposase InsO family protein
MTFLMLLAVAVFTVAEAQDVDRPRYGTSSDLRGLTRLFVDTGADVRARERIIRELRTAGIRLQLVEDARDAQILLEFGASVERRVSGWVTNRRRDTDNRREESVTTPTEQKIHAGAGTVYVVRDGRLSIVESFADEKRIFFERDPAINFARAFLRLYRGANGLAEGR